MQNEILELTKKLISFKTITGNTKEIAACFDFIKNYFKDEIKSGKIIAREYEKNDAVSMVFSNARKLDFDIILNGHIDVIAAPDKDFAPKIKNGKLYARGAADMKSQVATMMIILKELINSGFKKSIALLLGSDEEVGGESGIEYLIEKVGYKAAVAIIPDGGENFELTIKEKGVLWLKITAKGKTAHGSRPWLGENAILKLMRSYKELEKIFPSFKKTKSLYQDGISMNLGKVQGGKIINTVPDSAEMQIDFRYSEKGDDAKIISAIKALSQKHRLEFEIIKNMRESVTDAENIYLKKFKKITEKIVGRKMKISKSTGASCSRFFSEKNIPAIITSPDYGNIHAAEEWIDIKGTEKLYKIIKEFLTQI